MSYQLKFKNRKSEPKDFISLLTLHPRIVLHLFPHPLLDSLEQLLHVSHHPVTLHYDTVFNIGDYYMSTLTFRHALFVGDPIIPCGFLIHSRRYHSDHRVFIDSIIEAVHPLATKCINIVTDREFKFATAFPVGSHLYCWNHLERDLHWHLKTKCNSSPEEVSYFTNTFKQLINASTTEIEFDRDWEELKGNERFMAKPKICNYFQTNLIPVFKAHAAIWILKAAGIPNPNAGITNNPSESMNAVFHRLQHWKQVPLDTIAVSMYHLCTFYHREIERGIHQGGTFQVKDEFDHLKRDPSLTPCLPVAIDPKKIVDHARSNISLEPSESKPLDSPPPTTSNNQVGLAHIAINERRVKIVEDGAWVVMETDGITPCAVRLFPKETCTCPSTKTCYHITACRLMIGLPLNEVGKCNVAELRRNHSKMNEKPAGRKKPRKNDFKEAKAASKQNKHKTTEGNF